MNLKTTTSVIVIALLTIMSCSDSPSSTEDNFGVIPDSNYYQALNAPGSTLLTEKESEVYRSLFSRSEIDSGIILIDSKVVLHRNIVHGIEPDSINQVEAYNEYIRINESDSVLTNYDIGIGGEYFYFNSKEFEATLGGYSFREVFIRKYPNSLGYYTLSRIGFNSDSTMAIVTRYFTRGWLYADYKVLLLKYENNEWVEYRVLFNAVS